MGKRTSILPCVARGCHDYDVFDVRPFTPTPDEMNSLLFTDREIIKYGQ